jgi:hypothetical protein
MIPNHALMVMAWAYAPDSFRDAMAIICTAGWDTDCNAANVGSVMGVKVGLDGINTGYDFQAAFADRVLLPTAEGTRSVSDCLLEAGHIARIGRKLMGWPEAEAPKGGAWHHFSQPGSRHGYLVEPSGEDTPGTAAVANVEGPSGVRALQIDYRELGPDHPVRVSTVVTQEHPGGGYVFMGVPRLFPGQTVTLEGMTAETSGGAGARLYARCFAAEGGTAVAKSTHMHYGERIALERGRPVTLMLEIPDTKGFPVKDLGVEITGEAGARGRLLVDRVSFAGAFNLSIPDELPRNDKGVILGWIADLDRFKGKFSEEKQPMTYICKNKEWGVITTGTNDWTDYSISCRFNIHCADRAGLLARYQGLRRYVGLIRAGDRLQLVRRWDDDERVVAEVPCDWAFDQPHDLALSVTGDQVTASVDGRQVLSGRDDLLGNRLSRGGAGYCVERGTAGFRDTAVRSL